MLSARQIQFFFFLFFFIDDATIFISSDSSADRAHHHLHLQLQMHLKVGFGGSRAAGKTSLISHLLRRRPASPNQKCAAAAASCDGVVDQTVVCTWHLHTVDKVSVVSCDHARVLHFWHSCQPAAAVSSQTQARSWRCGVIWCFKNNFGAQKNPCSHLHPLF